MELFIFFLLALLSPLILSKEKITDIVHHKKRIVIWVHGTYLLSSARFKTLFNSKEQLKLAEELEKSHYFRSTIEGLKEELNKHDDLYVFGWSGRLSNHERRKAAGCLYTEIKRVMSELEKRFVQDTEIYLISHSHGGNVILNMVPFYDRDDDNKKLCIERAIFLACPVQESTAFYTTSSLFKKIYSFYSKKDLIQVLAPNLVHANHFSWKALSWYPFSYRRFPDSPRLQQAAIALNGKQRGHNSFRKKKTLCCLLSVLQLLSQMSEQLHKKAVIDIRT